ncbi:hypothetical protein MSG28_015483 [Choristoneura fumiferana]|uniref:Uncharacterized protein n=1 Tax=Choristoneura fumiferana TaxID=7141 RepID=A0ACC0KAX9_CHOFU|nr:hypothetical protein MSG28_015483 [Choristoneura fumiferana]
MADRTPLPSGHQSDVGSEWERVRLFPAGKCNVHLTGYLDPEFKEEEEEAEDEKPTLVAAAKRKLENSLDSEASKKQKVTVVPIVQWRFQFTASPGPPPDEPREDSHERLERTLIKVEKKITRRLETARKYEGRGRIFVQMVTEKEKENVEP